MEHAGEVVTREQLRQAVWGTGTFVDFDGSLNYCIAQIRSALGDSAEAPRFVRTVPRQGYQFVAPITPAARLAQPQTRRPLTQYFVAAGLAVLICAGFVLTMTRSKSAVRVAVARFDNETGNSAMDAFASSLGDMVVAELTAGDRGRLAVIGNAAVLWTPRPKRDLTQIASSLNAGYVILGQVQRHGTQILVLAHLIRMPGQTHVKVVRLERELSNPFQTESEMSHLIAVEFLRQLLTS